MREIEVQGGEGGGGALRRLLIGLVLVGMLGLGAELVLLEHYNSGWQWIPMVSLALGVVAGAALLARPGAGTVRAFRVIMMVFVVAGALGAWLHLNENLAFEREMDSGVRGLTLMWEALRGATPALAPGALAHLGLLGLAGTYRHPALRRAPATRGAAGAASFPLET